MLEVLIGLVGVMVGAGTTAGIAWWGRRDLRREQGRIAARLLLGEAVALSRQLHEARQEQRVLPDAGDRARRLLEAWRERPEDLSGLPIETWYFVTARVHELHVFAVEADDVSGREWSTHTDFVYEQLERLLAPVDSVLRRAAGDSREASF
jgi:hypothetical protein